MTHIRTLLRWDVVVWLFVFSLFIFLNFFTGSDAIIIDILNFPFILGTCFITLSLLTSDFISPSLHEISRNVFGMSDRISGMTLLALGNAIPEITTTYHSMNTNVTSLAIGELYGGVFFLLTVVLGSMSMWSTIKIGRIPGNNVNSIVYDRGNYFQDVITLLVGLTIATVYLHDGRLSVIECISMVIMFIVCSLALVFNSKVNEISDGIDNCCLENEPLIPQAADRFNNEEERRRYEIKVRIRKHMRQKYHGWVNIRLKDFLAIWGNQYDLDDEINTLQPLLKNVRHVSLDNHLRPSLQGISPYDRPVTAKSLSFDHLPTLSQDVFESGSDIECSVTPIGTHTGDIIENDTDLTILQQAVFLLTAPISYSLHFVIPTPVETLTHLTRLQIYVLAPVIFYWSVLSWQVTFLVMPIMAIMLRIALSFFETKKILSIITFSMSLATISGVVQIIVKVLTNYIEKLNLEGSLIGMTILAWGNNVGDLISNLTFIKIGIVDISMGACFGSPLLYFLLGIGVDGILLTLLQKKAINFTFDSHMCVCCLGILVSFLTYIVAVPLNDWKIDKKISCVLLMDYITINGINLFIQVSK
ncbi:hypothetical protein KAFR_0H01640 [Kazachstania africana CBS 2517]|uniref:Sodium/calcium exchanger membrane region domain-containing protein n=1 Tax=Kazachstania africana (strain ATCC 22294 / BCRC 22015 / CBS 2517 / CECT 1963 / NBRC 1671 / NRRL Y-8276) TaxID=1071382 RepID=H2AZ18_KAZAF|nr:hypothetical protein KAFR_0H01640 [Kazachstania africana CBS 2517]CCF59574.1 hypothetical protein KAFR_0H01640 [Kazachstania africana CBS 2517]